MTTVQTKIHAADDFVGLVDDVSKPDVRRLYEELRASEISVAMAKRPTFEPSNGSVSTFWRAFLSSADNDILARVIERHSGVPWVQRIEVDDTSPKVPTDQKRVMTNDPSTAGFQTWIVGAGDGPGGRGEGERIRFSFSGPGDERVELVFAEPIEVFAGVLVATGSWGHDDLLDVSLVYPATTATDNVDGTGNANKVPIAPGVSAFVPADGNGAFDIDVAIPIMIGEGSPLPALWDLVYNEGGVIPSVGESGNAVLLDVESEAFFCKRIPIVTFDSGKTAFKVHGHRVGYCPPGAKIVVHIAKTSDGAGEASGHVDARRRNVTTL